MEQNSSNPVSLLANLRSHHIVKVLNPLSRDFTWTVARSVSELDSRYEDTHIAKMGLRNDMHPTLKHVTQSITLPQGRAMNLPGDVAQVVVKHLVDEIMSLRGHKATIGDPELRRGIEEEVVMNTEDLRSQLSTLNVEEQLNKQIADLNRESISEEEVSHESQAEEVTTEPGVFGGSGEETGEEEVLFGGGELATAVDSPSVTTESAKRKK